MENSTDDQDDAVTTADQEVQRPADTTARRVANALGQVPGEQTFPEFGVMTRWQPMHLAVFGGGPSRSLGPRFMPSQEKH